MVTSKRLPRRFKQISVKGGLDIWGQKWAKASVSVSASGAQEGELYLEHGVLKYVPKPFSSREPPTELASSFPRTENGASRELKTLRTSKRHADSSPQQQKKTFESIETMSDNVVFCAPFYDAHLQETSFCIAHPSTSNTMAAARTAFPLSKIPSQTSPFESISMTSTTFSFPSQTQSPSPGIYSESILQTQLNFWDPSGLGRSDHGYSMGHLLPHDPSTLSRSLMLEHYLNNLPFHPDSSPIVAAEDFTSTTAKLDRLQSR